MYDIKHAWETTRIEKVPPGVVRLELQLLLFRLITLGIHPCIPSLCI